MTAPPRPAHPRAPVATRRLWAATLLAAALLLLCVTGLSAMDAAQQAVTDELRRLCATLEHPESLRWSHGYEAWLPIGTAACAGLAVILALVPLLTRGGPARGARVLAAAVFPLALLALFFAGLALEGFYAFPGGDISTVGSPPCGAG